MPVYNGQAYLAAAIESVLAQSFASFELIICDDVSTDSSRQIALEFAARDSRIKFFANDSNHGLFENYNICLGHSTGRFIKPFAQDDLLSPQCLERMVRYLEENQEVSLVSCGKRWIGKSGEELKVFQTFPEDRIIAGREVILYNLLRLTNWVGEPSTVLFRKELAGTGFDTAFYHSGDLDYWFRIIEKSKFGYLNETLAGFRRHPDAETNRNLKGMLFALDLFRLGRKYRHILDDFGETEEQFQRRTIETIALNVNHQVEEGLTADQVVAIGNGKPPRGNADVRIAELESALAGFKEVSFYSMRYLTSALAELDHLKRTRVDELALWQSEMKKLLESPSWKVTAPLRALKDIVRSRPSSMDSVD